MVPVLVLPGIGNSGPGHWQTRWEEAHPRFRRVHQRDWDHADRREWVSALDRAVNDSGPQTVIAAHSLGCLVVAHWASDSPRSIGGALLVAPPDPMRADFPKEAVGFKPVPMTPLPFPSILVASANDPYSPGDFAWRRARAWKSRFVSIGPAGHINSASNLGEWPVGMALLEELIADAQGNESQ